MHANLHSHVIMSKTMGMRANVLHACMWKPPPQNPGYAPVRSKCGVVASGLTHQFQVTSSDITPFDSRSLKVC